MISLLSVQTIMELAHIGTSGRSDDRSYESSPPLGDP